MANTKSGGRRQQAPASSPLPKITTGRFEDAMALIERLYEENVDLFLAKGEEFRARHREATGRPLTPAETAQIAAGLATDLKDADEQVKAAGLAHHDEPQPTEVLAAAGLSTAPAFMLACRRVVALLELPGDDYEQARELGLGVLWSVVDAEADQLRQVELLELRVRAQQAFEHLAAAVGVAPGKAWGLIANTIWQAMTRAAGELGDRMRSGSSTSSAASTAGPDDTSSTSSGTGTPSS